MNYEQEIERLFIEHAILGEKGKYIAFNCLLRIASKMQEELVKREQIIKKYGEALVPLLMTQGNSKWIPCSERLPEKDGEYYTTCHQEYTGELMTLIVGWSEDRWRSRHVSDDKVIAWMPLPEPFKGELWK